LAALVPSYGLLLAAAVTVMLVAAIVPTAPEAEELAKV